MKIEKAIGSKRMGESKGRSRSPAGHTKPASASLDSTGFAWRWQRTPWPSSSVGSLQARSSAGTTNRRNASVAKKTCARGCAPRSEAGDLGDRAIALTIQDASAPGKRGSLSSMGRRHLRTAQPDNGALGMERPGRTSTALRAWTVSFRRYNPIAPAQPAPLGA